MNRCSRIVLAALLVLSALAAPASAVSVDEGETSVPDEGEVGTQVTATIRLTELYRNPRYERWRLAGSTELTDVTWTVRRYDQTGAKVGQRSYDGQNFTGTAISADNGTAAVEVTVTGTVPEVENFSYDPPQRFLLAELRLERGGGTSEVIDSWRAHHFTEESAAARKALDEARAAIEAAGNPQDARNTFESAVQAFNGDGDELDLATRLANEAKKQAEQAQQSRQTRRLLLYAGAGVVVVLALAGGVLYWRSRRSGPDRLG